MIITWLYIVEMVIYTRNIATLFLNSLNPYFLNSWSYI